jgi:hypothetical protein
MGNRRGRVRGICILGILAILAAGRASAAESNIKSIAAGLSYEHITRTVVWAGDSGTSTIKAHVISARADVGLAKRVVVSLSAGLSFTGFSGLTFDTLPISLQFDGSSIKGFNLAAEVTAPLKKLGEFEVGAAGRFAYSFGMSKTWPLEGFAVEGEAKGQPSWMEISAGPRVAYLFFGRVVPYLELSARMLWADFRMSETLGELSGEAKKRVKGDFAVAIALGADAQVTKRVAVKVKGGIMPFAGGVDTFISIGALTSF